MELLAIDPGTTQSGFVLLSPDNKILESGVVENDRLLEKVRNTATTPTNLAIENIVSYGTPVGKSTFQTCIWIGRFFQTWVDHSDKTVWLVDRTKIKSHICEGKKGNDSAVIQALTTRFGSKGTKKQPGPTYGLKSHAWQAFALGVYCIDKLYPQENVV